VYCSPGLHRLLGYEPCEKPYDPETWFERVHPDDVEKLRSAVEGSGHCRHGESEEGISAEFRLLHADETFHWISMHGIIVSNASGQPVRRVGSITDITTRMTTDQTTGLLNRLGLEEAIDVCLKHGTCNRPRHGHLISFQFDQLSELSLVLSSALMDGLIRQAVRRLQTVLCEMTAQLQSPMEQAPKFARLGAKEFGIFLGPRFDDDAAHQLARDLMMAIQNPFPLSARSVHLSISVGVCHVDETYSHANEVIRDAGVAMRTAARQAPDRLLLFDASMRVAREKRNRIEADIHNALPEQQFEVYYQPVVEIESGIIHGFEALLRWKHPELGMIPPCDFIPVAEENGMILEIGAWVLRQACRQGRKWLDRYQLPGRFEISVNLSIRQCRQPDLAERVQRILLETGLPAANLSLELTESLLSENLDATRRLLRNLKALGLGLKLDDFGTGFSSLQYLCDFPFDCLKIDRSFIARLQSARNEADEVILSIVDMGSRLNLDIVAEGIETPAHSRRLQELGCKNGQGYLFSRPVEASAAEALLQAQAFSVDAPAGEKGREMTSGSHHFHSMLHPVPRTAGA